MGGTNRLRGQLGSDALMPKVWPVGSYFVLLNGNPEQKKKNISGSAGFVAAFLAWPGTALVGRAVLYSPERSVFRLWAAALHALPNTGENHRAGVRVSWIRRSRIDADSWQRAEVPLGEEAELYTVRLVRGGEIVHEDTVTQPLWLSRENEVSV